MKIRNIRFEEDDTKQKKQEIADGLCDRWGINGNAKQLLHALAGLPSGFRVTQVKLAEMSGIRRCNINRALNMLTDKKYVKYDNGVLTMDWLALKALASVPIEIRTGEVWPEYANKKPVEDSIWLDYGLGLPDVNPEGLTPGCMVKDEDTFEMPEEEDMIWIPEVPEEYVDSLTEKSEDEGLELIIVTYDLPF